MGIEAHAKSRDDASLANLHEDVIRQTLVRNAPQFYEKTLAQEHAQTTKSLQETALDLIDYYTDGKN